MDGEVFDGTVGASERVSTEIASMTDEALEALAERVGQALLQRGLVLAVAESCTGGWIAKAMTDISGSSQWLDRGFVTYSNAAKTAMLGVPDRAIAEHGAVSEPVAEAMARGALAHSEADVSVAVTGIAGPEGGSAEKPVGTVWLAWARGEGPVRTELAHYAGDRDAVRRQAVMAALEGVLDGLD